MAGVVGDFGTGNVKRSILRIALPMTLAQLINVLYNVVDRVYIGHIEGVGTTALTGVGLCLPIITIISAFTQLFGIGGAPLFSMARGAGDRRRAERIMGTSFLLLLISGVALAGLCYVARRPILYLFGASDDTYPYAESYISVYLLGTLFVMTSLGMNSYVNAQGFGVTGMLTVLIGAALNLILDPLFIFAFDLGVRGAAIATVISQGVSAAWVYMFLAGKRAVVPLTLRGLRLEGRLIGDICALGLSGFIMAVTNGSVQIICNATLKRVGGDMGDLYVGVMTVINSVREIITLPVQGLTGGAQPVISFNYGAKKNGRVIESIRFMTVVCVVFTCCAWLVLFLFPQAFIRLFNDSSDLVTYGVPALHIYFFGIFMMALQFSGQSAFVALGKSRQAVFFSLLRKAFIVIPLTLILPSVAGLGVNGVFVAEPVSNFVGGIACFTAMFLTVRKELGAAEEG